MFQVLQQVIFSRLLLWLFEANYFVFTRNKFPVSRKSFATKIYDVFQSSHDSRLATFSTRKRVYIFHEKWVIAAIFVKQLSRYILRNYRKWIFWSAILIVAVDIFLNSQIFISSYFWQRKKANITLRKTSRVGPLSCLWKVHVNT